MFPSPVLFALTWFLPSLTGDVYIQPTQDTKNPVIYGVFSVSGLVYYNRYCICMYVLYTYIFQVVFFFIFFFFLTFFLSLYFLFTALSLKAQQFVSTPWPTSAWSSTDLLPTRRVPITSGWPTLGRSPTLDPARWVSPHMNPTASWHNSDFSPT